MAPSGRVTIADVAAASGVGVGTVSRVINGAANVRESTRRSVLTVIKQLGYRPSYLAASLSRGTPRTIAIVVPHLTTPSAVMRLAGALTVLDEQGVILTSTAAAKVSSLLAAEGRDDLRLRIAVQPGGCSGLRYQLYFDEREIDGDVDAEFEGVHVVTDKMSAPYLTGATIDFVDTIEKQGFTIDNPNATGSCACGDSFH